ncbi:hypothetical protein [Actinokineospora sp.]|uniref:hypothetical protein n=1 Tax=Actinokineospora sp. TaxID=1872133 RepID=UPI0040377B6B
MTRRTFVGAVAAAAGTAALASPALAAPGRPTLDRAVGVIGGPRVLALVGRTWVLVDENGAVTPTRGLGNAVVVDVTSGPAGHVAVGSITVGAESIAAVWESADGVSWREATRLTGVDAEFTTVGAGPTSVLALGALLTTERSPSRRIVARRMPRGWVTVPVRGLEWTDELAATAVAGTAGGWTAAAVDASGSVLANSRDGVTWSTSPIEARLTEVAVKSLSYEGDHRVRWIGNGMGGSAPLAGVLGAGRTTVAVPEHSHAVGVVPAARPIRSFWLADGRLVASTG